MAANKLYWRNRSSQVVWQRIYRSTSPIDKDNLPAPLAQLGPTETEFTDDSILLGVEYHYLVSISNGSIELFSEVLVVPADMLPLGPGSQTLVGHNDTAGFFGEVPVEELISGDALASALGLTAGIGQNSNSPWLKFFIDDKIYFVAKQPFRHTISWVDIKAVNAVDGSNIILIDGFSYRVGLLEGIGDDHSVLTTGYDAPITHGSEWNRLMYNIALPLGTASDIRDSQVGDHWVNYPQTAVADGLWLSGGNGIRSWCKEVWPGNANARVFRGNGSVSNLSHVTSSGTGTNYGWRPRLELVTS